MEQFTTFVNNQQPLFMALSAVLLVLVFVEWRLKSKGPRKVTPSQATLLINRENAVVVDIRSKEAFQKGHVIGAKNFLKDHILEKLSKDPKNAERPIVLVCENGAQAPAACSQLGSQGFDRVYCLAGGLASWRDENFPLEK